MMYPTARNSPLLPGHRLIHQLTVLAHVPGEHEAITLIGGHRRQGSADGDFVCLGMRQGNLHQTSTHTTTLPTGGDEQQGDMPVLLELHHPPDAPSTTATHIRLSPVRRSPNAAGVTTSAKCATPWADSDGAIASLKASRQRAETAQASSCVMSRTCMGASLSASHGDRPV